LKGERATKNVRTQSYCFGLRGRKEGQMTKSIVAERQFIKMKTRHTADPIERYLASKKTPLVIDPKKILDRRVR
jgi:hypothetical protein